MPSFLPILRRYGLFSLLFLVCLLAILCSKLPAVGQPLLATPPVAPLPAAQTVVLQAATLQAPASQAAPPQAAPLQAAASQAAPLQAAPLQAAASQAASLQAATPQVATPQAAVPRDQKLQAPLLTQNVRKTVLDNGLTVLTKEVNTAPVVSVQVWYRVGSRNETPGINGIAHQLEHLMFKGTRQRPVQFGRFFSALGSDSNAFTSYDQTAYFGTVEQDKLQAMLTLESDRMMNSIIDEAALTSEKRVVISELQGYENSPSYRLGRAVQRAALPTSPYGLPVGGTKADVESFTVQQVRDYYRRYYRPDNATLVIVGNIQTDAALALVRETFGPIAKPDTPLPTTLPKALSAERPGPQRQPIILREPGSAALLNAVYPLPNIAHPDMPALQVLDYILTGGRSSRLYQALVETGLASGASGYAANMMGGGWYDLSMTAAPGKALADMDAALDATLARLRQTPVSAEELDRAKTQLRASLIQGNRDIASQAQRLGDDQTSTGDYQFSDRFLSAITQVTSADVQRVATAYLAPARRTVGWFEPTQATADGGPVVTPGRTGDAFNPGAPLDPAELAKYLPPLPLNSQRVAQALPEKLTLANGLTVLLLPDRSSPTVTLSGYINAGTIFDKTSTAGLASLVSSNLMNGTGSSSTGSTGIPRQDALAIAKTLENRGAKLSFSTNREGTLISGLALSQDLPMLTNVLASVLQRASFPTAELELSRQRALTSLKLALDNPASLGRRVFQQAIYPSNHPFYVFPTEASLQRIQRQDLVTFYQQHYRPDQTLLTLVGDFDPTQVRTVLNQAFGTWGSGGPPATVVFPPVSLPSASARINPALPGKTQAVTYLGYSGIHRRDARFYAVQVLNQILGGDTLASRLGTEIRDRQGLTYGIYSAFQAGINAGPLVISMQTDPADTDKAIASTLKLLQQLRDQGVSASEVTAAVRSLTGSYPVGLANPDSLAETLLMNQVYGLTLEEIRQYTTKLAAITPAQVNQVIQDLIYPERMVIVTAGPKGTPAQAFIR
jgi:zinc protease